MSLDDGVTEDEAVAAALWDNPSRQATLADLGVARADLTDANQLPNPTLALLFPFGAWPIEALWQPPRRVQAALADVARVARGLVQNGLDVARDGRGAHAEITPSRASLTHDEGVGSGVQERALYGRRSRRDALFVRDRRREAHDCSSRESRSTSAIDGVRIAWVGRMASGATPFPDPY